MPARPNKPARTALSQLNGKLPTNSLRSGEKLLLSSSSSSSKSEEKVVVSSSIATLNLEHETGLKTLVLEEDMDKDKVELKILGKKGMEFRFEELRGVLGERERK